MQCLQVSTAVARPSLGALSPRVASWSSRARGDASALPWSSTEAHWCRRLLSPAPFEDHSPRQACHFVQDTMCFLLGQDPFVKTQCCGSHLAAPTVDRLRRSTVGLGTHEDLHTLVKYFAPALQRVHTAGGRVGELPLPGWNV